MSERDAICSTTTTSTYLLACHLSPQPAPPVLQLLLSSPILYPPSASPPSSTDADRKTDTDTYAHRHTYKHNATFQIQWQRSRRGEEFAATRSGAADCRMHGQCAFGPLHLGARPKAQGAGLQAKGADGSRLSPPHPAEAQAAPPSCQPAALTQEGNWQELCRSGQWTPAAAAAETTTATTTWPTSGPGAPSRWRQLRKRRLRE